MLILIALAIQTGWDKAVLHHCYYSGLAEWIKDVIGQQGKPTTLDALKTLAHSIDACHWEQLHEKSCSGTDKSKTDNKSDNKSNKSKSNNQSSSNNNSNANNSNNSNSNAKKNNNNNKSGKLSSSGNCVSPDKLGRDGKLTPQECQWWFDKNLCSVAG